MNTRTFALALALSGAALPALAQQTTPAAPQQAAPHARHEHGGRMGHGRGMGHGSPMAMLIQHRQDLGLTENQVSRLQAVGQRLQAQRQPLVTRLRALRPDSARRAAGLTADQRQAIRAQAEPIRQQLREQHQAAFREVQSILTDQQKQKIASTMRGRMHGHGRRAGFGRHGHGHRGGFGGSAAARLIARQQQLGLSTEQVSRLQAIDAQLKAKNQPILAQLQSFRPDSATREAFRGGQLSDAQKQALGARREQARPLVQQLRDNQRQAMEQVRGVLTPEQQSHLREQMRAGRQGAQGHGRWQRHGEQKPQS
jgi:Spy/CpxP family protein refolding chaperone